MRDANNGADGIIRCLAMVFFDLILHTSPVYISTVVMRGFVWSLDNESIVTSVLHFGGGNLSYRIARESQQYTLD